MLFKPLPTRVSLISVTKPRFHLATTVINRPISATSAQKSKDKNTAMNQQDVGTPKRAFEFLGFGEERGTKPRSRGITEIRGPYYSVVGKRYLSDVLETSGQWIDSLKFAGGSFTLLPERTLRELIDLAHSHNVTVSTGGFIERVLVQGSGVQGRREIVDKYLEKCKDVGFDILELSSGFITLPLDDWARLVERCHAFGVKPKPEVGIQFGAGGTTEASVLEAEGTKDVDILISQARRFLDMGITESVKTWRTDVISKIVSELGYEKLMFEASDPEVFTYYIKTYGPDVNLFVDHSQILQLEGVRQGIWGVKDVWGRVTSFK
ncbi:phosphosulfolactate synthase [Spizellomyces sp. 'palustris']|nr:phosphosulfolactate synthase [Spizellomyces sp. 'palustris']